MTLLLKNSEHAGVAEQPLYWAVMVDLDNPTEFLKIPSSGGGFIRPGDIAGPYVFIGLVKTQFKTGDRLFGSVGVTCPTCLKERTYWLFIKGGEGGWYEEQQGPTRNITLTAAKQFSVKFDGLAASVAPPGKRIPIGD